MRWLQLWLIGYGYRLYVYAYKWLIGDKWFLKITDSFVVFSENKIKYYQQLLSNAKILHNSLGIYYFISL